MYERILVPVDGSPSAREAARHARTVADWTGASVILLHVVRIENPLSFGADEVTVLNEAEAFLEELLGELFEGDGKVRTVVRRGRPHEEIAAVADEEGIDLVVMGRGSDGVRQALGSTSRRVSRTTRLPLLLVSGSENEAEGGR